MSQSKLSKKYIGSDQVGSAQVELENNSSLRAKDSAGVSQDLLKLSSSDQLVVQRALFLSGDASSSLQAIPKQQLDASILDVREDYDQKFEDLSRFHELHVYKDYPGLDSDGSPDKPFKTIQAAIDEAAKTSRVGANNAIYIHLPIDTTYVENLVINNVLNNLFLIGMAGVNDSVQVRIDGSITISGASTRIRLKDLQVNNGTSVSLSVDGTEGRHYFQNVQFVGPTEIKGAWKRWIDFIDCSIPSGLTISGTPSSSPLVTFYNAKLSSGVITMSSACTLNMYNTLSLGGIVNSTAGSVSMIGGSGFSGSTGLSISGAGALIMMNVSMMKSDLSLAPINKTGAGPYFLSNVVRNEASDVLAGSRIMLGSTVADFRYSPAVPSSWSGSLISGKQALDESMAKIVLLQSSVSSIQSSISALQAADLTFVKLDGSRPMTGQLVLQNGMDATGRVEIKDIVDGPVFIFEPSLASLEVVNSTLTPGLVSVIQPGQMVASLFNEDQSELLASTSVEPGIINLWGADSEPAIPTQDQQAATKLYVDQQIGVVQEAVFYSEMIVLSASDIVNQYIDLSMKAHLESVFVSSARIVLNATAAFDANYDFRVDNSGLVSRLHFQGPSASAGSEPLAEGQILFIKFIKLA